MHPSPLQRIRAVKFLSLCFGAGCALLTLLALLPLTCASVRAQVCKVLDCRCFFRESLRGTPTVRVRGCVPSCSALPTKEKKNSNGANNTATKKEEVEPPKAPGRVSNSFGRGGVPGGVVRTSGRSDRCLQFFSRSQPQTFPSLWMQLLIMVVA